MVTIRKRAEGDGTWYEVEDFPAYVETLRQLNVEPPPVNYRVFLSSMAERAARAAGENVDRQIARFFRIGSSPALVYRVSS